MPAITFYKRPFITLALCGILLSAKSQNCTAPGQTPVSAIFVCGTQTFYITTPTMCGQTNLPTPCPSGFNYQNTNPNFFRFACYTSGTVGFKIEPDDPLANYNWQIFDITSVNPVDIFTNPALFVDCNWSSDPGETGASSDGTMSVICEGPGRPLFNKMPDLQAGRTYLMMVTNQSGVNTGYNLSFGGGTAVITDAIEPRMVSTSLSCDGRRIQLQLNKQVKCNSVAPDGSDFSISGGVNVIGAVPDDCSSPFGTGYVTISLDQPLPLGNHVLTINTGSDGNSLLDICTRNIEPGQTVTVISSPAQPTPMGEVRVSTCGPSFIELLFSKPMLCSSIAPDGSDFIITGSQSMTVTPVLPACNNGTTNIIRLNLSAPVTGGNYVLTLTTGTDGNTILNDCTIPTPAGSAANFAAYAAASALFNSSSANACSETDITFLHDGANNVNSWAWDFGNGVTSNVQNPFVQFAPGEYNVKLTVSNGQCSDTRTQTIRISEAFEAIFKAPLMLCPGDSLHLENISNGNIDQWQWDLGNGISSSLEEPVGHSYSSTGRDALYTIRLIVTNTAAGCKDTVTHVVKVLGHCYIAVPSAFTPNGDGKNDFLYPLNALKADQLEFRVYNRFGQQVFFTRDWTKKWDGRINGVLQDTGVYAWMLSYISPADGQKIVLKGTTLLLR